MAFDFNLNVVTGGSGAAVGLVATNLDKTEKHAKHAAEGVKLFEAELGKASASAGGLTLNLNALSKGGGLFTFDLAEGAKIGYEIVSRLVEKVVELGREIVKSVAENEDLGVALDYAVGPKQARQVEELADAFADVTRYKDDAYKQAWLPLLNAGMKDMDQLALLTSAAGDIAVQMNTGEAGMKENLAALGKIALGGKMKEAALKQFNIHPKEFYAEIAQDIGTTQEEAAKMLKAGKIGSDKILATILSQVNHRGGDKGVGAAMLASAATMGGLMDRLSQMPDRIFDKLAGSEGMEKLKGTLGNVITAIEEKAPAAIEYLNGFFTRLFGDVSGPDGLSKIKGGLEAMWPVIVSGADAALVVIKGVAGAVVTIANAINSVHNAGVDYDKIKNEGGVRGAVAHVPFLRMALDSPEEKERADQASAARVGQSANERLAAYFGGDMAARLLPSASAGSVVHYQGGPVTVRVDGSDGRAPEKVAEEIAHHAREAQIRIGQELSSHT